MQKILVIEDNAIVRNTVMRILESAATHCARSNGRAVARTSAGRFRHVATDHDLEREGVDLLRRYRCVVSGTHPEYYSAGMFDAWEDYLATGGRGW